MIYNRLSMKVADRTEWHQMVKHAFGTNRHWTHEAWWWWCM